MNGEAVRGDLVDTRRECRCKNDGAEPILLDLHEAARALHVSERTVWGLAKAGAL
jgi:hypothetical protein